MQRHVPSEGKGRGIPRFLWKGQVLEDLRIMPRSKFLEKYPHVTKKAADTAFYRHLITPKTKK